MPTGPQVFATVIGVPLEDGQGMRFEMRLSPSISNQVDFLLMMMRMCVESAARARAQERAQPQIQVPQIQLPPGVDLRSRGRGRGGRKR